MVSEAMSQITLESTLPSRWKAISLRRRRLIACVATLLAIEIFWCCNQIIDSRLGNASLFSGSVLLACLFVLVAIGARRRLMMLPLWSVSTWLQIHLYTGIFACAVFVIHAPRIIANGWFEGILSWLFIGVSASGIYGIFASRTIPKRLTAVPTQPRYERIDWHRDQYRQVAAKVFESLSSEHGGDVLADFYTKELRPYFESGLPILFRIQPDPRRRRALLADLGDLKRYLSGDALEAANRFSALIRHRDELDYHHGLQWKLRCWVIIHAALSLVLMVWSVVHAGFAFVMLGR
jgi:hypothetical protein